MYNLLFGQPIKKRSASHESRKHRSTTAIQYPSKTSKVATKSKSNEQTTKSPKVATKSKSNEQTTKSPKVATKSKSHEQTAKSSKVATKSKSNEQATKSKSNEQATKPTKTKQTERSDKEKKKNKNKVKASISQPMWKSSNDKALPGSSSKKSEKKSPAYPVRSLGSLSRRYQYDETLAFWQWPTIAQRMVLTNGMEGASRLVRAKYAFKATNNDELSFHKGDTITLTQPIDGGWWEGTLNGKTGWFPSNYVIELQTDDSATLSPIAKAVAAFTDIPIKEQHHLLVAKHLVESEEEYVNELQTLLQQYLRPLSTANVISSPDYLTLCGNLSDMTSFQIRFLHSLTECSSLPILQQRVGGIFLSNASQMQSLYHCYAANHPNSVSLLAQYREELSAFMEAQGATTPGAQALTSYLSSPFRRLDKYPALLKELERHIDDAHPDRGDTQRAIAMYKDILTSTIEVRKDKEMELEVLLANIKNWEGEDLLSLGDVELSAHVKVHTDDSSSSDRIMLMFPTCILMISVSKRMSYYYQGKLQLSGLKVTKVEDTEGYTNALQLSGTMIEEMIVSFNSPSKQAAWFHHISNLPSESSPEVAPASKPKSVQSSTMPLQVTSKASVLSISNSAKTAQVIDSYDRLGLGTPKMWSLSCLRPLPPSRPQFVARDDTKSPKLQRKASTLGRRKNNVDDTKVLQEDAKILKVIESYCTSARTRHTVNSSILDSPNMLIAEDEKIICEITKDNQTVIEERSLVDTVYLIKDQIKDLQSDHERLKKELEDERKARKKLESIVHKNIQSSSPLIPLSHNNHNSEGSQ